MDRKRFLATGGAAAAAAAVPAAALADPGGGGGGNAGQGLVGSWFGTVTAEGLDLSFDDVISFLDGGVVVESRRYALVPPGAPSTVRLLETTGHGAWTRTGNRSYEVFFRFLLQDDTSLGPAGTDNIRLHLSLDGDALDGTFDSEALDPAGNSLGTFHGTYTATRIAV